MTIIDRFTKPKPSADPGKETDRLQLPEFIDSQGVYRPRGGELFIHSHYSEPADGLESDGIDLDDFDAFDKLVDFVVGFDRGEGDDASFLPSSPEFQEALAAFTLEGLVTIDPEVEIRESEDFFVIGDNGAISIQRHNGELTQVRDPSPKDG